jgi:hypothetical protein
MRAHVVETAYKERMGVQLYLLDRRKTPLVIAGSRHLIGTLRRSWKLTEINDERAAEISAVEESLKGSDLPAAAMVAEVVELPLFDAPESLAAAHTVIGWEPNRYSVTDVAWDFLPILGFAVRPRGTDEFVLHEEHGGGLVPMVAARAAEKSILDGAGRLLPHGQPLVTKCFAVKALTESYVMANCELADGRTADLVTELRAGGLPPTSWYEGKLPSETKVFSCGGEPVQP